MPSAISLHTLPAISRHSRRVGRGVGSRGAKSGRGMKGQKSRAGYTAKTGFEGGQTPLYMRLPKGRGTKQVFSPQGRKPTVIAAGKLAGSEGDVIGYAALRAAGLLPRGTVRVKLIGGGSVPRKMTVRVHAATPAAVAAVEAAGGKVEIISSTVE